MKLFLSILILPVLVAAGCTSSPPAPSAKIKGTEIKLELADTPEKQRQGLSYRSSLDENAGMLFDFTEHFNKRPNFWMKEMKFNIDIVWIKDQKIIFIHHDVPAPESTTDPLPHYQPPEDIDYVLEVNSGFSEKHNWQIGDEVVLNL